MPRHVITCPGAFKDYNFGNFGGAPFQAPNTIWDQPSDAPGLSGHSWGNWSIANSAAVADVADMDAMMRAAIVASAQLPILVCGHSRGAQMIYKWLRELASGSTVQPGQVRLISSGNPERRWSGAMKMNYAAHPGSYPGGGNEGDGWGLTNTYGHEIYDISRPYDKWADYMKDYLNTDAQANLDANSAEPINVHSNYQLTAKLLDNGLPEDWDEWSHYLDPTNGVHYMTAWAAPLVSVPKETAQASLFGGAAKQNRIDSVWYEDSLERAHFEIAYERPRPLVLNLSAVS